MLNFKVDFMGSTMLIEVRITAAATIVSNQSMEVSVLIFIYIDIAHQTNPLHESHAIIPSWILYHCMVGRVESYQ